MDKIARIRQEIERQKEINKKLLDGQLKAGCLYALNQVLSFLNTLSEEPDKSLEEEIDRFEDWMETYNQSDYPTSFTTRDIARHFAEWGAEHLRDSTKMIDKSLEEYVSRAGFDYVDGIVQEEPGHRWNDHDVEFAYRDGIIAGAEWQASRMPMPEDTVLFNKGVAEGRRLEREDMLKDVMEGEVVVPIYEGDDTWSAEIKIPGRYNIGNKVRIIIVKEE